jgi:hypothetical protein
MTLERRIEALEKRAPPTPTPPAHDRDPRGALVLAVMFLLSSSGAWRRAKKCDCRGQGHFCHAAREKDSWADALSFPDTFALDYAARHFPKRVDLRLQAAFARMLREAGATELNMPVAERLFADTPDDLRRHAGIFDLDEFRGELPA